MLLIRQLLLLCALGLSYFLAGHWGLQLGASFHSQITYLWPPSGLAFAALALLGRHQWPGILLGAAAINFDMSGNLPMSVLIAAGNTLSAWLPLYLAERYYGGFDATLSSTRSVTQMLLLGALLGCGLAAFNGVGWLWLFDALQGRAVDVSFRTWWMGDATGLMTLAPLMLTLVRLRQAWLPDGRVIELVGMLLLLAVLSLLLLAGFVLAGNEELLLYMLFPMVVWAGLRFSQREVTLIVFLMFLSVSLAANFGVWDLRHYDDLLIQLQLLFLSASATGLLLAAAVGVQRGAVEELAVSERRYRQLSELSRDVISRHTPQGRFMFVSAACDPMFGYSPAELVGRAYCEFCHPDDLSVFRQHFAAVRDGALNGSISLRFQHRLGHYIWLEITANCLAHGDNGLPEVVMVARDVTRRKIDEAELQESEERYRKLIELMPDALLLHKDGVVFFANTVLMQILEVPRMEQLIGQHVHHYLHPSSRELSSQRLALLADSERLLPYAEMQLHLANGKTKDIEVSSNAIRLWGSQYVITLVRDVSARKKAEAQQRLAAKVFEVVMEGIIILNARFEPVSLNPAFEKIVGYRAEELSHDGMRRLFGGLLAPDFFDDVKSQLNEQGQWQGEIALRRKDGRVVTELLSVSRLQGEEGDASHYVAVLVDITYLKQAEEAYRNRANQDPLTRLPNRNLLQERLQKGLVRSRRNSEKFALLFVDLDGFKAVNDGLGHEMGDIVLRTLAARLVDCVRQGDTVARYGGDEFVMLVEGEQDVDWLAQTAERIIQSVRRPIQGHGRPIRITASVGIALYPEDGNSAELLLRRADLAMYQAKHAGKDQFCFYRDCPPNADEGGLPG